MGRENALDESLEGGNSVSFQRNTGKAGCRHKSRPRMFVQEYNEKNHHVVLQLVDYISLE